MIGNSTDWATAFPEDRWDGFVWYLAWYAEFAWKFG